jgi:Undecaprenyl-phosphate glucose phosphotransferase
LADFAPTTPDTAPNAATARQSMLSPELVESAIKWVDFTLILATASVVFTLYFSFLNTAAEGASGRYILTAFVAAIFFCGGLRRVGGYTFRRMTDLRWQATRIAIVWGVTVAVLLLVAFVGKESESFSRGWALSWTSATVGLLILSRAVLRLLIVRWGQRGYLVRRLVVVGAGELGENLVNALRRADDRNLEILGFFDDRHTRIGPSVAGLPVLGTTADLLTFARRRRVDEFIVALPLSADKRLKSVFERLRRLPVDLRLSAEPIAGTLPIRGISAVGAVPMLDVAERPLKNWNALAKLIEDRLIGVFLLLLFTPLMALVALLIKLDSRGPVLFVQERFGFNNNVIRVLEFRTMYIDRGDATGAARTVRNDPRVTRIGRLLRALSLDELPQLINVVRGDMSLVGPRPHAITMRAGDRLYNDAVATYLNRHRVKPGITGWAQVNGLRGEVDSLEKARARVEHDLFYIEHWSVWLDIKILLKTAPRLFAQGNAY